MFEHFYIRHKFMQLFSNFQQMPFKEFINNSHIAVKTHRRQFL